MARKTRPMGPDGHVNRAHTALALLALAAMTMISSAAGAQTGMAALTADQKLALDRGETVRTTRAVADWPWPEVAVYRHVAAEPVEVAAVHADFDSHKLWSPDIVESRVVKRPSPGALHVVFEYRGVTKVRYTLSERMQRAGDGYETSWESIEAEGVCRLGGHLMVEKLDSRTVLTIVNRVDPCKMKSFFGGMFGGPQTVVNASASTAKALAERVERLKAEQPNQLAELVRVFTRAVQ